MAYAEMLFFIDNQKAKIFKIDGFPKQGMGSDDDINRALCNAMLGQLRLSSGHKPRQLPHHDWQTCKPRCEGFIMLAGQQRRRYNYRNLFSRKGRYKGSPKRNFRFTKADIAT